MVYINVVLRRNIRTILLIILSMLKRLFKIVKYYLDPGMIYYVTFTDPNTPVNCFVLEYSKK
jgi:hypothetical protein